MPDGSTWSGSRPASGTRSAQAFDAFGRLFIVDNDPDSRPPCRLVHVVPGGDYGYRFRNGRKGLHPFTAWNGELPGTLPMAAGTGEVPSGVLVYESDQFPADYRGAILSTSWGDHRIERFRLKPSSASFKGVSEPIVSGGEDFRPVAIATAPDGSVYFSDWVDKSYNLHGKGRVWRVSAKSPPCRVVPKDDAAALSHADRPTREEAAARLLKTADGRSALSKAAIGHDDPRVRATAVDVLWNYRLSRWEFSVARGEVLQSDVADALRAACAIAPKTSAPGDHSPRRFARRSEDQSGRRSWRSSAPRISGGSATKEDSSRSWIGPWPRLATPTRSYAKPCATGWANRFGPDFCERIVVDRKAKPAERLEALLVVRAKGGKPETVLPAALNDPDPDVRFVAVQWVAEARLDRYRHALQEGLASGAVTCRLFEAYLAALERLDGKSKDSRDEQAGESYVATLLADPKTPSAIVRRGLRVLRPEHPVMTLDRLQRFLASGDAGVRLEAVRTLRDTPLPGRFEILAKLAADELAPAPLRAEAIVGLAPVAAQYKPLLLGLAEGNVRSLRHEALRALRNVPLDRAENERAAKYGSVDPETAALLALLSGSPAVQKAPSDEPLAEWLARIDAVGKDDNRPADPLAGERISLIPKAPAVIAATRSTAAAAAPDPTSRPLPRP